MYINHRFYRSEEIKVQLMIYHHGKTLTGDIFISLDLDYIIDNINYKGLFRNVVRLLNY